MSDKPKPLMLKTLDYIPALTLLIIFLGYVRVAIYYYVFNLPIFTYMEPSDYLSQGLTDLGNIALCFLVGFSFPAKGLSYRVEKYGDKIDFEAIEYNANRLLKFLEYLLLISVGGAAIIAITYTLLNKEFTKYLASTLISALMATAIAMLLFNIPRFYLKHYILKFNKISFILLIGLAIYTSITGYSSYDKALSVKFSGASIGNSIQLSDSTIKSTKDYYYIGETKANVFFHNVKNNGNDVYEKSDIKKITVLN